MATYIRCRKLLLCAFGGAASALVIANTAPLAANSGDLMLMESSDSGGHWDPNWDRRHPSEDKSNDGACATAVRHLILVRHGQNVFYPEKDMDSGLTLLGREQAACTGQRLYTMDNSYTSIINSPMNRARETSNIIAGFLPEVRRDSDDLLREGIPAVPDPPAEIVPSPEVVFECGTRMEAAFRKYFHRAHPSQIGDSYSIIVCHSNLIRYFICRSLQLPATYWARFQLYHASITMISIYPSGRVKLKYMGDAGYMSPEKMTVNPMEALSS